MLKCEFSDFPFPLNDWPDAQGTELLAENIGHAHKANDDTDAMLLIVNYSQRFEGSYDRKPRPAQ